VFFAIFFCGHFLPGASHHLLQPKCSLPFSLKGQLLCNIWV